MSQRKVAKMATSDDYQAQTDTEHDAVDAIQWSDDVELFACLFVPFMLPF